MSEEIIKVLEYIGGKIGIAIDWTQANALPYVQDLFERYIAYEVWTSVVCIVVLVGALVAFAILEKFLFKQNDENPIDWEIPFVLISVFGGIAAIVACVFVYTNVIDIITCAVFPEKIILALLNSVAL